MAEILQWTMPEPPPWYVLTVVDDDGLEWHREDDTGLHWNYRGGLDWRSWTWLLAQRGPLTAGKLAP